MEQSKSLGVYSGYFTPATRTVYPAQTVFATSSLGHADVPRRRIKGPAERRGRHPIRTGCGKTRNVRDQCAKGVVPDPPLGTSMRNLVEKKKKKSSVILTLGSVSGGGMIKSYSEGFNAAVKKKNEKDLT